MGRYNFRFAGTSLADLYGVLTETPPREIALYDYKLIPIPGKSGDDYIDNKRYENVTFTRKIGLVNRTGEDPEVIVGRLLDWLSYNQGYQEFEDTDHPGLVTYAVLTNFAEVQTILRRHYRATLQFSRVPFWYSKTGLEPIVMNTAAALSEGIVLTNPYPAEAQAIYELVFDTGKSTTDYITLKVGSVTKTYILSELKYYVDGSSVRRYVTINLEIQEIKAQTTRAGGNIAFSAVSLPPTLKYGEQTDIKILHNHNNALLSMTVYPRWRCL